MQRLRRVWLKVHLYLGLTVGLLFAFTGLTGSLIVFDHALDEQLNAGLMLSRESGPRKSLAEVVTVAEASRPSPARANSVSYPRVTKGVFTVAFKPKGMPIEGEAVEVTEVFVDPVTAEVLGERVRGSGLIAKVYTLHSSLLAGKTGQSVMGGMAALVLVSIVTGVVLWWPLRRGGLAAAVGIRQRKLSFDLHKASGLLFTPVLFLIAWTGTHLALPAVVKPVVTSVFPETKLPLKVKSVAKGSDRAASLTADDAAGVAEATMPGCRLMMVELPAGADDSYRVFVRQQGEVGDLRGVGRVWVDRYSGEVLATRDWTKFTAADTYFRIQLALHSGDAFGLAGRWLFCVAGLIPALLWGTGFLLWWKKKRRPGKEIAGAAGRTAPTADE